MNPKVDAFVKTALAWREEIVALRAILLETGLEEELKWGKPCYVHEGSNVAIVQPFKGCLGLMFFKGALLADAKGLLVDNGPNSRSAKRLEFRSVEEVDKRKSAVKAFVKAAIAAEAAGLEVEKVARPEPVPEELEAVFRAKPAARKAFAALTPGRRRAYILHFSSAKLPATRRARIEKCLPRILEGKGLTDR